MGLCLAVSVVYFTAFKQGAVPANPLALALLAGSTLVAALGVLGEAAWLTARGRLPRGVAAGRSLVALGLLAMGGAGLANWLLSLQGAMILTEGEARPLSQGSHLDEFVAGPLASPQALDIIVGLREVELISAGTGGAFVPRLELEVSAGHDDPRKLTVKTPGFASFGSLRFYGGAFGFAPHIVIQKDEQVVFDRQVPFTSRRHGPVGISFDGHFTLAAEDLEVQGSVLLDTLNERMQGHPTLGLTVLRAGAPLGRGTLKPGHFADLEDGYSIGFAGLKKWAEVDVTRRNYPEPIFAGMIALMAGAVVWPVAAWRRSR